MSAIEARLAELGVQPGSAATLDLDSLGRFELLMLLEEVAGRDLPTELILSLETCEQVYSWMDQLRPRT
jgi:acyl carrier protein